jgi:hypothetical protein
LVLLVERQPVLMRKHKSLDGHAGGSASQGFFRSSLGGRMVAKEWVPRTQPMALVAAVGEDPQFRKRALKEAVEDHLQMADGALNDHQERVLCPIVVGCRTVADDPVQHFPENQRAVLPLCKRCFQATGLA